MKILLDKNPEIKEAVDTLGELSIDPAILSAEEARNKALSDYNTNMAGARQEGLEEGLEKGRIEGMLLSGMTYSEIAKKAGCAIEDIKKIENEMK